MNYSIRRHLNRGWQLRYGLAVITSVCSLLIRLLLVPILGLAGPFLLFAPAIMFSAAYGGMGAGLLATGVSGFLANYFLLEPTYSLKIANPTEQVRLVLFMAIGVQISVLSGRLLTAKDRAEKAARQAKETALSLERSEERYRLLIEGVRDYAIFALDTHGFIASWNEGAQRLKGYETAEITGQHFSQFYTAEDLAKGKPQHLLEQAMTLGQVEDEGWRVRKDGSCFWADVIITALRDEHGSLRGFSNLTRDITERRHIEDERKEAVQQLQRSLKELTDMKFALDQAAIVATTDPMGIIRYVNDKFCEVSKYSREELIGKDHRILNSDYHSKSFFQDLWATIAKGKIWKGEIKNRAKDGTYYWVDTTIVPFLNEAGKPSQYLAIRFDITNQKQAESGLHQLNNNLENQVRKRTAQLLQSLDFEATLKRITDKVRDSLDESTIVQTAVQELGKGLGVNCCYAMLYDLDQQTATVRYEYNTSMFPSQGEVIEMSESPKFYQQLLKEQYLQFCNLQIHPIRGYKTTLVSPIVDDQGALGDLWLMTDKEYFFQLTEVRLVQQVANQCAIALRQAHLYQQAQAEVKALERVNWLKDDFLSTVSHELRTPVANMRMSIRMLEINLNQDTTLNGSHHKVIQYLQILKSECEREISLINDLLDLQRLEAGKLELSPEAIDLKEWIAQAIKPFYERAEARQQTIELYLPEQNLPPLLTDCAALERILAELLNNACKYTPPGEKIVVSLVVNSDISHADQLQLCVTNFGSEIPKTELPRIFDKFYRIPNADPWKQGGTGLGLALIQRLLPHLNGSIQVSSENNRTTFAIALPYQSNQGKEMGGEP